MSTKILTNQANADTRFCARCGRHWLPSLALFAWVIVVFGDVLLSSDRQLLSEPSSDIKYLFLYWREFGFAELRQGNLALWNPYLACGVPFFGGFQAALLYPVNALYLFLPLGLAINLDFVLHVFLIGVLQFGWLRWRGQSVGAALLGALLLINCGPVFLRIFAGHLTPLAVMAWAPLVLWSCEALLRNSSRPALLAGSFAVAMQVLAGYPQYMVYTAVAAVLWSLAFGIRGIGLIPDRNEQRRGLEVLWHGWGRIALMYGSAVPLTAVQLLPGLETSQESIRSQVTRDFAATFSLGPESFITMFAPGFFGDDARQSYWGRGFYWEMSLYFGVVGAALAAIGFCWQSLADRWRWASVLAILFCFALGSNTPLFDTLYQLPVLGSFRAWGKFSFSLVLLATTLAAIGFDCLLQIGRSDRNQPSTRNRKVLLVAASVLLVAIFCAGLAWYLNHQAGNGLSGAWGRVFRWLTATGDTMQDPEFYHDPKRLELAARYAVLQLTLASGLCVAIAILLWMQRNSQRAAFAARVLAALALAEMTIFACANRPTFPIEHALKMPRADFLSSPKAAALKQDERFLARGPNLNNIALTMRAHEMGGYDPVAPRRYVEFMLWTQGESPDDSPPFLSFPQYHRLYRMLRCRYFYLGQQRVTYQGPVLPRALLVPKYSVAQGDSRERKRTAVFSKLSAHNFDPVGNVVLESEPFSTPAGIAPARSGATAGLSANVRVVDSATDWLEIEATAPQRMILLVTDNYARGWRVRSLEPGSQQEYSVMPANWTLRGIPLEPGRHHIRLEYAPQGFVLGRWVSLAAWAVWIGFALFALCRYRKESGT